MTTVNQLEVVDWLTMECARMLGNELFIAKGFNSDFAKNYDQEFAVGETVRVPLPWRPIGGEGLSFDPEAIDRRHFTTTVDKIPHVHFEYNSVEEALRMVKTREAFSKQILKPAMQKMAQKIELYAADWAAVHSPNVVGTLGTDQTTFGFAGQARAKLIELAGWTGARRTAGITPSTMQAIVNNATVTTPVFNPTDKIAQGFVEGYIGENGGWQFSESMSLRQHTAGTWQTPNAVTIHGSDQSGSSLVVDCTSGDTFKKGDKIGITGRFVVNPATLNSVLTRTFTFTVLEDVTATGTTATLSISPSIEGPGSGYQNISVLPQNGDALTLWPGTTSPNGKQGSLGVFFNRDAFAIVPVKLKNPTVGGTVRAASQNRDPDTGVSVAYIEAFDPVERRWINRLDALLGFGDFYNQYCSVVLAGA